MSSLPPPTRQHPSDPPANDGRDETTPERLDRNTIELLNELRVAGTGVQVMFAFLLVVPFQTGWKHVSPFERTEYFVTLICVAAGAVLLIAPSIHHRILFRHHQKPYLVTVANRMAILAMVFLALGFSGILVLISDVVIGGTSPVIAGILCGLAIGAIWFGMPIMRRSHEAAGGDFRGGAKLDRKRTWRL